MAFVYRYLDEYRRVKYYGLVNGDDMRALNSRIYQHSCEPQFSPAWDIEYIDGLTRTDADLLETHFINADSSHLINKAKRHRGPITLEISYIPEWKKYSDPKRTSAAKKILSKPRTTKSQYDPLVSFTGRPLQLLPGGYPSLFNSGLSTAEIHSRILYAHAAAIMFDEKLLEEIGCTLTPEEIASYTGLVLFVLALLDAEFKEEIAEDADREAERWNEQ